ncbi:serine protease Do [Plasticicumulans lactativorans]|uniref:Probable periplasmic serine endoprotease DegP-like n=1 Tax=Plasticicumulans lactativorans TaxID=1133106 RepID=A0A4R2LDF6_9GAMM|nr:Do family serine endopeptidase [Plasticicumulans lactativorans]TCO83652.1 serine protease Do [Plasticicumulans lactativorans]
MQAKRFSRSIIAAAVLAALTAGYAPLRDTLVSEAHAATSAAPAVSGLPDFSSLVERFGPAVVNVSVVRDGTRDERAQLQRDDPMYEFFRHFPGLVPPPSSSVSPSRGLGSGFIVDADGVILTNAHVVDGATEVRVKLTDQREFPAKVIGSDRQTDVAVLRIDAHGLPTVNLGDAADTHVGEWVLAIGSPYGFENTVTAGIVSAKSRQLPDETYVPFIQTDVAVNPGNSGGPLFNLKGEVIGINSQIYSRTGGYQGLSFAVPIDVAIQVKDQLLRDGHVSRGRLGVSVQAVDQALADAFGLGQPHGALVGEVDPDGPAAHAGLKPGDIIVALDGKPLERSGDLPIRIAEQKPGTRVTLEVWRQRAAHAIPVTLGEVPDARVAGGDAAAGEGGLGLALRPLSPQEQAALGVPNGLRVEAVRGAAARAGVQPGDVVLAANGTPVNSAEQLKRLLPPPGQPLALLVQRGGATLFLPVQPAG